jgi:pyrroline-5-carboxylate reductase
MPNPDSAVSRAPRIAFIGGGNMARSLVGGLIARGAAPAKLAVSEPQAALREALARAFGIPTHADNRAAVNGADLVVLAVKPQAMRSVCEGLAGIDTDTIVVSIAAGITCDQIARWLRHGGAIVRCMPNTPALLGAGATGLHATPATRPDQREAAAAVLASVGLCVWIEDEACMDAVTALSGSGPAYVFLLAEAMQEAGVAMGLPAEAATVLTRQTLLGAARMLDESGEPASTLRERVTSPGGTTQAALERFEADGFRAIVRRALAAAQARGAELSRQLGD